MNHILMEGLSKCAEYMITHSNICRACCSIGINSRNGSIGGRQVVDFYLQSVQIYPNVPCPKKGEVPTMRPIENLINPWPPEEADNPMIVGDKIHVQARDFEMKQ